MLRAFFAAILSLLLFLSSFVLCAALGGYSLLYLDIYRSALEKGGIYAQADRMLADYGRGISFTENASAVIDRLLANTLAYVRGDAEKPNLTLEIDSSSVIRFFEKQAANFTVCKQGEEPYDGDAIKCRPANRTSSQFLGEVLAKKGISAANFSSVDLLPIYDSDGNVAKAREIVSVFRSALMGLAAFSVILVLAITKISGSRRWAGAALLLAGVAVILLASYAQSYALSALPPSVGTAAVLIDGLVSRVELNGAAVAATGAAILAFPLATPFLSRKRIESRR